MKSLFSLALVAALGLVALTPAKSEARYPRGGYYSTPYYSGYNSTPYYGNNYYTPNYGSYYAAPSVVYGDSGISTSYYVDPGANYVAPTTYYAPNYGTSYRTPYAAGDGYYSNGSDRKSTRLNSSHSS